MQKLFGLIVNITGEKVALHMAYPGLTPLPLAKPYMIPWAKGEMFPEQIALLSQK